jgi:pimeloyl-ACP methyl ester carboxylesterase
MKSNQRFSRAFQWIVLISGILVGVPGTAIRTAAQDVKELQSPKSPLVLKAQGSFFVGGEKVEQTHVELGSFGPAGHISVNQMYVRYMIPVGSERKVPVVMVHGMTLTGKTWETTPDGRMGWDEYFVRKGHSTYVPDQVGRGRSGFNQAIFNNVRAGLTPPEKQPWIRRFSDEVTWPNFRFGAKEGVAHRDEQFPVTAVGELSKQGIPDLHLMLPSPNPNYKALSDLAIQLKQVVLMGHSQSGAYPLEAALVNPTGIKGMVLVEPGSCPGTYTDQQITALAKFPILVVFGDHLGDNPTGIPGHSWKTTAFDSCQSFITRVNAAGGKAQILYPPDRGIKGNSHKTERDSCSLEMAVLMLMSKKGTLTS